MYAYFKRGWQFVAIPIAVLNFILISYRFLVERVPVLHTLFPSLTVYIAVIVPIGAVLAVLLGYWDYKHGTAPRESERIARFSPWNRSLARAIYYLAEGDTERAKEAIREWM